MKKLTTTVLLSATLMAPTFLNMKNTHANVWGNLTIKPGEPNPLLGPGGRHYAWKMRNESATKGIAAATAEIKRLEAALAAKPGDKDLTAKLAHQKRMLAHHQKMKRNNPQ